MQLSKKSKKKHFMTLKEKIAARLKAIAAGVNLSKTRIDAIVARAEKGLTDESDDTAIDANLTVINELTPFKDIAALDDHERAKAKKIADEKEAKRIADIAAGKEVDDVEIPADTPEWAKAFMKSQKAETEALKQQLASVQGDRVATTRREQYAKTLEGTSDVFKAKALKDFDRMAFKDDEDFTSYLTDAAEDAKGFIQEEANQGLGGDRPTGGVGGNNASTKKEATEAEVEAAFSNLRI